MPPTSETEVPSHSCWGGFKVWTSHFWKISFARIALVVRWWDPANSEHCCVGAESRTSVQTQISPHVSRNFYLFSGDPTFRAAVIFFETFRSICDGLKARRSPWTFPLEIHIASYYVLMRCCNFNVRLTLSILDGAPGWKWLVELVVVVAQLLWRAFFFLSSLEPSRPLMKS